MLLLGHQGIAPVVHLGLDELRIVALEFEFEIAFFQLKDIFTHG